MFDLAINERSRADDATRNALLSEFGPAYDEIVRWPGYAVTPLRDLSALAYRYGVRRVLYKDEGRRFGATSFKALGGAYAVAKIVGRLKEPVTFVAATGGNHGASVAWASRHFGCDCVLYIGDDVSAQREMQLALLGARIIRVEGGYDRAIDTAESSAESNGWTLISDTSTRAEDPIVVDVMAGYGVLARELVAQLDERREKATHLFIPCGVGGLAAAVVAYIESAVEDRRPQFIACEPEGAASVLLSIRSGALSSLSSVRTSLSCLACGRPSAPAWSILERGLDAVIAVSDEEIRAGHQLLQSQFSVGAGETAGAGFAAFTRSADEAEARSSLGLNAGSVVVILGTEGITPSLCK